MSGATEPLCQRPWVSRKRGARPVPWLRARSTPACQRWPRGPVTPYDRQIAEIGYRFGVSHPPTGSRAELRRFVREVESSGLDFIATGDHLGRAAPFSLLAAAASTSERLRLRTYVLNVGFWNPALLAREAATLDRLSGGRLELGLGAGTVRSEFVAAGLNWLPAAERVEQLERTLLAVKTALGEPEHEPHPVQRPIPLLVGAMSRAGLTVAAAHADIVAYAAIRQMEGQPPGFLRAATAEETDELVAHVRKRASHRSFESDVLLQSVELDRDPLRAGEAFVEREAPDEDPSVLAESPCVLFAKTAHDAAAEIERRRERWGFTSFTTFASSAQTLARVQRELS